jgi:hypothetical protein
MRSLATLFVTLCASSAIVQHTEIVELDIANQSITWTNDIDTGQWGMELTPDLRHT